MSAPTSNPHAAAVAWLDTLPRRIQADAGYPLTDEAITHLEALYQTPEWLRAKQTLKGRGLQDVEAKIKARKRRLHVVREGEQSNAPLSKSLASLSHMLRTPALREKLGIGPVEWDEMRQAPTIGREPVQDHHETALREQIERVFSDGEGKAIRPNKLELHDAVMQVAHENAYHPVVEYFSGLQWDGVPRIAQLLEDVLFAPVTAINQTLLRCWLISAVARVLEPGCKADGVLILQGAQGAGKSSFFGKLAGEWFSDTPIDMGKPADAALACSRVWLMELAELAAINRRDLETVKSFLAQRWDDVRLPYARHQSRLPRRCVFGGSSNAEEILTDPTGNRRFWIIPVGDVDLNLLADQRDQLWAEAVHAYQRGEAWHLDRKEQDMLAEAQKDFEATDSWEAPILAFMASRGLAPPTSGEVLEVAIEKPRGQISRADEMRIGAILRKAGYRKRRTALTGDRSYRWFSAAR